MLHLVLYKAMPKICVIVVFPNHVHSNGVIMA